MSLERDGQRTSFRERYEREKAEGAKCEEETRRVWDAHYAMVADNRRAMADEWRRRGVAVNAGAKFRVNNDALLEGEHEQLRYTGMIRISPARVIELFGEPPDIFMGKVTMHYLFENADGEIAAEIHDWKATSLSEGRLSPEKFRTLEIEYVFTVRAASRQAVNEFITWLEERDEEGSDR